MVDDFVGELKCVETDQVGAPISGNHLKGEATVITYDVCDPDTSTCTVGGGTCDPTSTAPQCEGDDYDMAKYNAIGVLGNEFNNGDGVLCLGGEPNEQCPDPEYNGCPEFWILNHFAAGAENPVLGEDSSVQTSITVVPCTQNFETQDPETVTLQLITYDEFENLFSSSTQLTCWADLDLRDIDFSFENMASTFGQTRIRPSGGSASGVMMVATEYHASGEESRIGSAAFNVHHEGTRAGQDVITIPGEQIQF